MRLCFCYEFRANIRLRPVKPVDSEIIDRPDVRRKEAFVGSCCITIGHAGEIDADEPCSGGRIGGLLNFADGVVGQELEVLSVDGLVMDVSGFKNFPEFP